MKKLATLACILLIACGGKSKSSTTSKTDGVKADKTDATKTDKPAD